MDFKKRVRSFLCVLPLLIGGYLEAADFARLLGKEPWNQTSWPKIKGRLTNKKIVRDMAEDAIKPFSNPEENPPAKNPVQKLVFVFGSQFFGIDFTGIKPPENPA